MFYETLLIIILVMIGIAIMLIGIWALFFMGWLLFGDIIIKQLKHKKIRDIWRQKEEEQNE